jgi:hypothetical protein
MSAAPQGPPPQDNAARGARLVRLSRWILLSGVLVGFAGCGLGIATHTPALLPVGGGLAFAVAVAAAIVGQIGRGLQGRVI